jgi:hypothetical protein
MHQILRRGLVLVGALCVASCQSVSSEDVRTAGIYAELDLSNTQSDQVTAAATLLTGGRLSNTSLSLTGNDRLVVYVGDTPHVMVGRSGTVAYPSGYTVTFRHPDVDTQVRIAFERGSQDVSAASSQVLLRRHFTMTPPPQSEYSRANDTLQVTWAPSDSTQRISWILSGDCIVQQFADSVPNTGAVQFPPGTLTKRRPQDYPTGPATINDQCPAVLEVAQRDDGQLDPAFGGGFIRASQLQVATFSSVP